MPRKSQGAISRRDSLTFRKTRQNLKAAFVRALSSEAPSAIAELQGCFPIPTGPITLKRRPVRNAPRPYNWPAFDSWAGRHNLVIVPHSDDWLRLWAASTNGHIDRGIRVSSAFERSWQSEKARIEASGRRSGVKHRETSTRPGRIAKALVLWQVLEEPWSSICLKLNWPLGRLADLRSDVQEAAEVLSLTRRRGRRGRPKKKE